MEESEIKSQLEYLQHKDDVKNIHTGDKYLYIESNENVESEQFRDFLSKELLSQDMNYALEVRSKDNGSGFVGLIGGSPEHPVQKATIFCGVLGLSDRETYQTLVKITELFEDGLLDEDEYSSFAASTIQVLSTSFKDEPYETAYLCDKFDLNPREVEKYTSKIIRHLESSE